MVTLKDIAEAVKLAPGTVSQILQKDDSRYSQETRNRVKEIATQMGYHANLLAKNLRIGKTGIVGFLMPQQTIGDLRSNIFAAEIIIGIENELLKAGYKVLVSSVSTEETEKEVMPSVLVDGYVEGMIVYGMPNQKYLTALYRQCRLLVVVDESPEELPSVVSANREGGRMAAAYLWQLGHRKFAFIGIDDYSMNLEMRMSGFIEGISKLTGKRPEIPVFTGSRWHEGGYAAARQMLETGYRPDAIFCVNDYLALHAMRALQDAGLKIPEDVSLMGFDDLIISEYLNPPLTTLSVDKNEIGRLAARLLIAQIDGIPAAHHRRIEVPVKIIERRSVRTREDRL